MDFVQVAKRNLLSLPFHLQARIVHTSFTPFGGTVDAAYSILNVCRDESQATDPETPPRFYVLDGNHRVSMVADDFVFSCRIIDLDINDPIAVAAWSHKMNSAASTVQRVMIEYLYIFLYMHTHIYIY